ncbi:MAG: porphobilinogen synthase [Gammaproteobacteria bacterium]|nr:porphobilinogen synthase [Gammaproteobacteria bacterium]
MTGQDQNTPVEILYPTVRMRRLRSSARFRGMVRENHVTASDLIYPLFFEENSESTTPITSMPGISRYPETKIPEVLGELSRDGVQAVMLFGVSNHKDATGSDSLRSEGFLSRMIRAAKRADTGMLIMADICFCEYTDHGHCGIIENGDMHNDQSLENLVAQAVIAADSGADVIAPSGMLDGMVQALRHGLDSTGHSQIPILSYSSKFASCFYGPFRDAAGSHLDGDRKTYQMDFANGREALRESLLDEAEGADMLMVKPGMPYLDVLARLRERTDLPLAVYQVSGEYAMIKFASAAGALDEDDAITESLTAFKRAGADLILSYFTPHYIRNLL